MPVYQLQLEDRVYQLEDRVYQLQLEVRTLAQNMRAAVAAMDHNMRLAVATIRMDNENTMRVLSRMHQQLLQLSNSDGLSDYDVDEMAYTSG